MLNNLSELHDFLSEKYPYLVYTDDEYYYCARFDKLVLYFDKCFEVLCIDNKKSFNKVSQCPIKLRFPLEEGRLLEALEYAKTKEFIKYSNLFLKIKRFVDINNRRPDGYYGYQNYMRFAENKEKQVFVR
mgnify:FL=1